MRLNEYENPRVHSAGVRKMSLSVLVVKSSRVRAAPAMRVATTVRRKQAAFTEGGNGRRARPAWVETGEIQRSTGGDPSTGTRGSISIGTAFYRGRRQPEPISGCGGSFRA